MKTFRLKAYFINTLLTIALCGAYCALDGILGMALSLLIVSLLGVVYYRDHYVLGITNSVLVLVILTLFDGPLQALLSGLPPLMLALTLAMGTRFKSSIYMILLWCTGLYLLDILVGLEILGYVSGGNVTLSSMMLDMGEDMRKMMLAQYSDPAYQNMIEQMIASVVDLSVMLAPAMFTIISAVLAYVQISVYRRLQKREETDMSFLLSFDRMQADKTMAIVYLILLLFLSGANRDGMFFAATCNVVLILTFLFFVLGLSVFSGKLKEKGTKDMTRKLMIGALICFSTIFFMVPLIAVTACGLTDVFFDYRHLRSVKKDKMTDREN